MKICPEEGTDLWEGVWHAYKVSEFRKLLLVSSSTMFSLSAMSRRHIDCGTAESDVEETMNNLPRCVSQT